MKCIVILMLMIATTSAIFGQKAKQATLKKGQYSTALASYSCPMHPEVTSSTPGKCSECNMDLILSKKEQMKTEVTHIYTCPMHPDVISNDSGNCPKCNTKLVVDRRGSKQGAIVYTCSMHPAVTSSTPGSCPKCGMALVLKKTKKDQ